MSYINISTLFIKPVLGPSITTFSEPASPYNASYPYNHVTQTESGHVVEFDDTPEFERIHLYHRSGSFAEWHPDGKVVFKSAGNMYNISHGNRYSHIEGHDIQTVDKSYQLYVNKDSYEIDSNFSLKVGSGGSYYANIEGGNYYITSSRGTLETNSNVFQFDTVDGVQLKGQNDLDIFSPGNINIDSDGSSIIQGQSVDVRSEGSLNLSGAVGGINLKTELGAIDISTTSIPAVGGIRLHTGASPINIVSDEVTQGGSGMINLLLGYTGAMGYVSILPTGLGLFTPTALTLTGNYVGIKSSLPMSISAGTGSLKGALFDLIDEIQKITVPTGTGNSGTPLNTAGFATLKTKILGFTT